MIVFENKFSAIIRQSQQSSIATAPLRSTTDENKSFKMTFSDFDKDKAEIESVCDNGKKTLSLIINGGYSMKVEY